MTHFLDFKTIFAFPYCVFQFFFVTLQQFSIYIQIYEKRNKTN